MKNGGIVFQTSDETAARTYRPCGFKYHKWLQNDTRLFKNSAMVLLTCTYAPSPLGKHLIEIGDTILAWDTTINSRHPQRTSYHESTHESCFFFIGRGNFSIWFCGPFPSSSDLRPAMSMCLLRESPSKGNKDSSLGQPRLAGSR